MQLLRLRVRYSIPAANIPNEILRCLTDTSFFARNLYESFVRLRATKLYHLEEATRGVVVRVQQTLPRAATRNRPTYGSYVVSCYISQFAIMQTYRGRLSGNDEC